MTRRRRAMTSIRRFAWVLIVGLAGTVHAQTTAPVKKGTVEKVSVHGAALQGNLEGDSPDRDAFIYLPPGYTTNRNQRYPVVYLLHGYGLTAERWMSFTKLAEAADKDIAAGTMRDMILVNPDAFTKYSGSMYSASPTTGDWESYIADDLVAYVDRHYRTIANRMSRGLGGHSMGGYGTVRIGMKRPDVFSSMYIMSACCLMNNPGAGGNRGAGARGTEGAAAAGARGEPAATTAATPAQATPPADQSAARGQGGQRGQGAQGRGGRGGRGGFGNTQAAQAAAWSSNPNNPPTFYDLPVVDGQPQPAIAAKWVANSPLAMVDQYLTSLKKYKSIMIEVGTQDTLAGSNRQLDESFTKFGIPHTF